MSKREEELERLWKETGGVDPKSGKMWLTPRMERIAQQVAASWGLLDVKCTNCHHEGQATKAGATCSWCEEGTMEKI